MHAGRERVDDLGLRDRPPRPAADPGPRGDLTLLGDGVAATTEAGPSDLDISGSGYYLYALNVGSDSISEFRVSSNGQLTPIGVAPGQPAAAFGLVAD